MAGNVSILAPLSVRHDAAEGRQTRVKEFLSFGLPDRLSRTVGNPKVVDGNDQEAHKCRRAPRNERIVMDSGICMIGIILV